MKSVNEKYIREAIGELLHLLWAQQCCLSRSPWAAVGAKAGTDDSFAYQTLPGTYPGRTMLSFSAPQAASEGKSALLIQLKACYSSTRLWAPAEHQPKFAQGLQRVSSSSLSSLQQSSGRRAKPSFPNAHSYCYSQAASCRDSGRQVSFLYSLADIYLFLLKISQHSYGTFRYHPNSTTISNKIHLDIYLKAAVQHNQTKYKKILFPVISAWGFGDFVEN